MQNPMLTLAKRWVKEDPTAALGWLRVQQTRWDEEFCAASVEDHRVNRGRVGTLYPNTTGHLVFIEGEVFVLADWIMSNSGDALEWINTNPVEDDILAEVVGRSRLPVPTKIKLIRRIENPNTRGGAAATLAWIEAPGSMSGQPQDEKLAEFHSLMAELEAVEGIQEDQKARLARIATEGKLGAFERLKSE